MVAEMTLYKLICDTLLSECVGFSGNNDWRLLSNVDDRWSMRLAIVTA